MPEREPSMIQHVKSFDARQRWGKLLSTVFRKEARVVVEKNGLPVAAVVSMDDLARLTTLDRNNAPAPSSPISDAEFEAALAANRSEAETTRALLAPPSPEELARRRAVYDDIQAHRHERVIAPLTSADLVHIARAEEKELLRP